MERNRNPKNIVIVTENSFPIGEAPTSRISAYASGFIKNGVDVHVVCYRPTESASNVRNKHLKGIYNGIPFTYSCKSNIINENILMKKIVNLFSVFRALKTVSSIHRQKEIDIVMIYSKYLFTAFAFRIFTKVKDILFVMDESEFQEVVFNNTTILHRIYIHLNAKYIFKMFDGIFVITKTLYNYANVRKNKSTWIMQIPILINEDRFNKVKNSGNRELITYCGFIGQNNEKINKDGVPILIDAFKIIKNKYKGLKLQIIGYSSSQEDFDRLNNQIKNLELENDVIFLQNISSEEIPKYILESKVLALARPTSRQADGGFPTKLGEYLMTGKPVVVTNVGEIGDYLIDGVNAFISEPNSPEKFANKLSEVLDDYDKALKIADNGKTTAIREFSNITNTKNILNFIKSN